MKDNAVEMAANDDIATRLGSAPYMSILSIINDIEEELKQGKSLEFPYVIRGETTDIHQMGFAPVTFLRQGQLLKEHVENPPELCMRYLAKKTQMIPYVM
ncbi:hypothetical protein HPB52_017239 [Rhipicephalus sanguineus]|uniref:Uncharacterized protein n=1 Tax=Rhipicephalus sanguineus TaxID=34632 RepID=A0A9D4PZM0_RHISA|nr:hypothetical protein HPB52_017239 [Rhipicephalus sanguineus]